MSPGSSSTPARPPSQDYCKVLLISSPRLWWADGQRELAEQVLVLSECWAGCCSEGSLWEPPRALQTLTPRGSPACARRFSGPWKIQNKLEMNVSQPQRGLISAGLMKWKHQHLSLAVYGAGAVTCFLVFKTGSVFSDKAVGWKYLWALYLPFFSAVHSWSQGADRLITKESLL